MKKLLSVVFALCMAAGLWAQASIKGKLVNEQTLAPIVGASVMLGNQNIATTTNEQGEFSLLYLEAGDEELIIEADGYVSTVELIAIAPDQTTTIDPIALHPNLVQDIQEEVRLTLSEGDMNDDDGKSQAQASSASASTDVFNSVTSWAWSTARYRNRGYEASYEQNYIEGISFNSAERGQFNFSAMGGLNDATRNKEVVNPIEATNFTFGGLGTSTNYLQGASRFAQGWKVGVAGTNRNYKARVNATYASGMLSNGWSFVGQIAYRFSPYCKQEGIIGEGIEYHSLGYFFSAEKKWDNGNRLSLITFGAPTQRGQSGAVTQEVYDLYGSINYNPYWGYQDGKMRNSRVVKSFDPTAIAAFDLKIDEKNSMKFAAGYHYSFYSNSAIQFYNAPDPRPDYYRKLPSYMWDGQIVDPASGQLYQDDGSHYPYGLFVGRDLNSGELGAGFTGADGTNLGPSIDPTSYNDLVNAWKNHDPKTTHIDWDGLYAANYANNAVDPTGIAKYMVERRHNDIQEGALNINYHYTDLNHLHLTLGIEAKQSQGIHFKTIDDLLGANQWKDIDPFADRDMKEIGTNIGMTQTELIWVKQNDYRSWMLNNHNPKDIKEGDRFGYDYRMNMTTAKVWLQNEWNFHDIDVYYALQITYSNMMRSTNMLNGRALYLSLLSNQMGENDKYLGYGNNFASIFAKCPEHLTGTWHHFVDPSFKAGFTYKINGRNHIKFNAMAQTVAPLAKDAYISQRVHDRAVDNIYIHDEAKNLKDYYAASQKVVGGDLTYEFNYPIVRGRVTGFYSRFWDGTELNGYYDDEVRTFVNQAITGINRRHCGIEAALSVKLGTYFTLTGATSVGDYRYTSNAYSVTSAENGMALAEQLDPQTHTTYVPVYETRDSVLLKGLRVSTGPQVNASLKLSFFHPKMWFADITVSYYDWNFLDVAPSRRMKGLFTGYRADGTNVNGWYGDTNKKDPNLPTAIETTDGKSLNINERTAAGYPSNAVLDENGIPQLRYPYHIMSDQESLAATNPLNRFIVDMSVGKLIYLPDRQSLSINLSVTNLTNNTHFKTGGYQQARLPRANQQGVKDTHNNSIITPNAWKFPAKYYYAWGANFYLTLTYKF